jgi:hypothetical protein
MRVNIYNNGITRFLEYLGPGNHMNVEVSPGIMNLLKRHGVTMYPSNKDPNITARRVQQQTVTQNLSTQALVEEALKNVRTQEALNRTVDVQTPEKKKNPQFMRPSDMNGVDKSVRFGKQVSDAGEVGIITENDMLNETVMEPQAHNTSSSEKITARSIHNDFVKNNRQDDIKNEKLRDIAEKRQRELEQGINNRFTQQPQAVDWETFDRQYMAEREAAEKAAAEADTSEEIIEDVETDTDDASIDSILESLGVTTEENIDTEAIYEMAHETATTNTPTKKRGPRSRSYIVDSETAKNTVYDEAELLQMTNKTLQSILRGRGHSKGQYSPTIYDSKEKLIAKIKATQTND